MRGVRGGEGVRGEKFFTLAALASLPSFLYEAPLGGCCVAQGFYYSFSLFIFVKIINCF